MLDYLLGRSDIVQCRFAHEESELEWINQLVHERSRIFQWWCYISHLLKGLKEVVDMPSVLGMRVMYAEFKSLNIHSLLIRVFTKQRSGRSDPHVARPSSNHRKVERIQMDCGLQGACSSLRVIWLVGKSTSHFLSMEVLKYWPLMSGSAWQTLGSHVKSRLTHEASIRDMIHIPSLLGHPMKIRCVQAAQFKAGCLGMLGSRHIFK